MLKAWGYIMDKVFSSPVHEIESLEARITTALATMIFKKRYWTQIEYHLDVLWPTNRAHAEIYEYS